MTHRLLCFTLLSLLFFMVQINPAFSRPSPHQIHDYGDEEILFIENRGQIRGALGEERPDVLFVARSQGVDMYITRSGITYAIREPIADPARDRHMLRSGRPILPEAKVCRLDMEFVGANPNTEITGDWLADRRIRYFTEEQPNGVAPRAYGRVTLKNLYEGIDVVYYSKNGRVKYDLIVKPIAEVGRIVMNYHGAVAVELDEEGGLVARTALGEIR